ncbi:hypothetical protein EIP91_010447 [Steccherinum ochraceum]|uniref:Uncharacterized protein n=1 Tax=Steccherinum ochraceum TaxID=92696 RepID=A0A4R0R9P0_9APHY|nr:hypothetical protein EIP91_010447 [Steccherinum ochraceum]
MNSSSLDPGESTPHLSTTTVFPKGTALPVATVHRSQLPLASIIGGAVAGVALAIVVVIGWVWWGKCIERGKRKERAKMLAALEVRENTRRNASSTHIRSSSEHSYGPSVMNREQKRSIKFASGSSTASTTPLTRDVEKGPLLEDRVPPSPGPQPLTYIPHRRSPLISSTQLAKATAPSIPPRLPLRASPAIVSDLQSAHRGSLVSTPSIYSTQSGEDRQMEVPPSLLAAALGYLDTRRPPSAVHLAPAMAHNVSDGPSRLSQVSSGSTDAPPDDHPEIPIGLAQ